MAWAQIDSYVYWFVTSSSSYSVFLDFFIRFIEFSRLFWQVSEIRQHSLFYSPTLLQHARHLFDTDVIDTLVEIDGGMEIYPAEGDRQQYEEAFKEAISEAQT